ncbi:hypothetical protein SVAN01_06272 [Stagonosporopsis vannaccii]|nr:hypothetical protein SVAN01_06272 [Stagonosporopsis vannaccii]
MGLYGRRQLDGKGTRRQHRGLVVVVVVVVVQRRRERRTTDSFDLWAVRGASGASRRATQKQRAPGWAVAQAAGVRARVGRVQRAGGRAGVGETATRESEGWRAGWRAFAGRQAGRQRRVGAGGVGEVTQAGRAGGYEERADAVLARLARPGQAGVQVSTSQAPPGGARRVRQGARPAAPGERASAKAAGAAASSGDRARPTALPLAARGVFWKEPLSAVRSLATLHQTVPSQSLLQPAPPALVAALAKRRALAVGSLQTAVTPSRAEGQVAPAQVPSAPASTTAPAPAQHRHQHQHHRSTTAGPAGVPLPAVAPQPACSAPGLLSTSVTQHSTTRSDPGPCSASFAKITLGPAHPPPLLSLPNGHTVLVAASTLRLGLPSAPADPAAGPPLRRKRPSASPNMLSNPADASLSLHSCVSLFAGATHDNTSHPSGARLIPAAPALTGQLMRLCPQMGIARPQTLALALSLRRLSASSNLCPTLETFDYRSTAARAMAFQQTHSILWAQFQHRPASIVSCYSRKTLRQPGRRTTHPDASRTSLVAVQDCT